MPTETPESSTLKSEEKKEVAKPVVELEFIKLELIDELDNKGVDEVFGKDEARVVCVVGPSQCGKTGLLSGIYMGFKRGIFSNNVFSGSKTLHAFEKRAHTLSFSSGRELPAPPRTKILTEGEDEEFLHLKVFNKRFGRSVSLIFPDVSGENFEVAATSPDEIQRITSANNSDHLVLALDGEKLKNPLEKETTIFLSEQLLRRLVESKWVKPFTRLQIVVTKADLFDSDQEPQKAMDELLAEIKKTLGNLPDHFAETHYCFISACAPQNANKYRLKYSLEELLNIWCENERTIHSIPSIQERETSRSVDNFIGFSGVE